MTQQALRRIRTGLISSLVAASLVGGCAPGQMTTQSSRIGPDDGTDSCRRQLVALDSTGNFFGAQILTGAAIGAAGGALAGGLFGGDLRGALIGAAAGGALGAGVGYLSAVQQQHSDQAGMYQQVQGDLTRENAQIDRTQLAFDQLTDCRFRQAQSIRDAYAGGRMDRANAVANMAQVRERAQRDLALASQINQQISGRTDQFVIAAEKVDPGPPAAAPPPPTQAVLRQPTALKLRPDPASPDIGQLKARENVTVSGGRDGYALVQNASGAQGYADAAALQGRLPPSVRGTGPAATAPAPSAAPASGDVRTLAGSNAARRDNFAQSVAVTQQAAASGFELAG